MEKKRYIPERELKNNTIENVVRAEAVGLYPSNELDEGLTPRSTPESRAGNDLHKGKK